MKISQEDAILIKNLYLSKRYGARRLLREFPDKCWKLGSIDALLKKIRKTGTIDRQPGSGRPRSVRINENIENVEDLVLSQEDKPKTHRSTREISRETGIHRSSVHRIIHRDLQLKCVNPPMSRVFYTFVCPRGGGKITPHKYLEFCGTYEQISTAIPRDVKASKPVWPRGQIIRPRPRSIWPRPRLRPRCIWPRHGTYEQISTAIPRDVKASKPVWPRSLCGLEAK